MDSSVLRSLRPRGAATSRTWAWRSRKAVRRKGVGAALLSAALALCNGWLGVRRVELGTYTDNHAAIGLFKKHGFIIERTAAGYAMRDGTYADAYLMARCAG